MWADIYFVQKETFVKIVIFAADMLTLGNILLFATIDAFLRFVLILSSFVHSFEMFYITFNRLSPHVTEEMMGVWVPSALPHIYTLSP